MVSVLGIGKCASPRSLGSPRVALLPGVNLYPLLLFSLLFLLALLAVHGARVFVVGLCVGRFLPLRCGRSPTGLAACSVSAGSFPCLCRSFLSFWFCSVVFCCLFFCCVCCWLALSLSSLSLSLLAPCCASVEWPWALGEPITNSSNSHGCNSLT